MSKGDGFTQLSGDTVPITPLNQTSSQDMNSETSSKYKNLQEGDSFENNEPPAINDIQLRFVQGNGSSWSLNSSTVSSAQPRLKWYRHPKVREHWKVVVASFVLFFIGLCLCIVGIILEALNTELGGIFMLFVIGVICFIPGVYHIIAVYYAVKGKRGFSFYNLPLFN